MSGGLSVSVSTKISQLIRWILTHTSDLAVSLGTRKIFLCYNVIQQLNDRRKKMRNPKGAGAKPTVWKHGGRGKIAAIHVPKTSKEMVREIAIIIDHNVIDNPSYDKSAILAQIGKILP